MKNTSARFDVIRSSFNGLGKSAVIFPAAFLSALGVGAITLGMIFYARDVFHASPVQVGTISALWSASYIAGCLLLRPHFDRALPKHLIVASTFVMAVTSLILLRVGTLPLVTVFFSLCGLAMSLFWPPLMGWLSRGMEGKTLGKVMAKYNFSWSVGVIASPSLTGVLSELDPKAPLLVGSGLFFLTCLIIIGACLALPKIREDDRPEKVSEGEGGAGERVTALRFPAWVGVAACYFAIGVILNIFPVAAREDLGFSKGMIGLLLEGRIVFATLGFILMGSTHFWHYRPGPMLAAQGALSLVLVLMVFVKGPLPLGGLISAVGFCMGVSFFYSMFHGISGAVNRSGMMALHESLLSVGLISGSFAGGYLYQRVSMAAVYAFSAAIVLAGLAIQAALSARVLKKEGSTRRHRPMTGGSERAKVGRFTEPG
jgi:MFS family permease